MKCSKCQINERHGSLAYCAPCNAAYMKAYRLAKQSKQDEPVATIEPVASLETPETPKPVLEPSKAKCEPKPSPVYWSFYLTKGSPLHARLVEEEKAYSLALS